MTELKTLKDIQIIGPDGVEDSDYVKGLLKAEAVKWVKLCESLFYPPKRFCLKCGQFIEKSQYCHREEHKGEQLFLDGSLTLPTDWIKHFFNLTEADLQEENHDRT